MLRVRMLSGNELVSLPLEELSDVKELKSRLSRIPGLPSRFRQRLSRCGSLLDDSAILDSPLDLELVLLPHSAASQTQADELVDASANGFASEVESMLQTPLHPDAVDVHGRSALVAASGQGHVQAVGLLLEANADKDRTNALGDTGLTVASVRGHVEVVRLLLEARADKDAIKGNWNPLMYASHQGHTEIVRLLLEAGADKDWAGNEAGFQAHGASFCVRGQWYAAECVQAGVPPVGCKGLGAPQVKNAAAVLCPKDLYYTSQVCEVKCDNGFRKTADLLCAPDGWLDAECLPAECRAPIVDNAEDLSLCAGSPHGSQCRVRCLEGFEASADHLVCDHGVWSYVLCEPRRCRHPPGAPPFAVGNFSACAGKLHGEYCKLTCEDGFDPVPSDGMRCERGRFSAAACEPRACPMPLVNNSGDLSDCFQHPSGSICELLCARGYVKAGANLYCDRGKWSPGACWPTPGCGAPPTVAHAESAEIRHCVNVARGERCDGFRCDVGFEAAAGESLSCLKHGAFSRPHCIRQRCGKPTLPPNGRGSQGCEGVPSGGVCRLLCKEGFAPRAAFHCLRGTFLESRCDLVRGLNSYAEDESLTLALHLEVPFSEWTNSEVSKPAGVRAARLSRAIAQAAGLRPWRLVAKNARPYSLSSTVLDLIMLPASYSEDDLEFEDFQRGAGLRPPPAFIALQRAQEALQNQSDQLQRALRLPGRATKILVKQLEVVSNTVGKMCSHPPVIEHAKDLSECAFTLSGHVCPLVCEAGFVHSGGLACQDGEWLLPHCVELGCDSVPVVAHAEDLSHCKNSASGSLCSIDCQPGFLRTGDIECRRGVWAQPDVVCQACHLGRPTRLSKLILGFACLGLVSAYRLQQAESGEAADAPAPPDDEEQAQEFYQCTRQCRWQFGFFDLQIVGAKRDWKIFHGWTMCQCYRLRASPNASETLGGADLLSPMIPRFSAV
eukprot:s280_g2.t5